MSELVSMREYARRRGVCVNSVSKAAKAGRITLERGKVNPETADRDWRANTDMGQALARDAAIAGRAAAEATHGAPKQAAKGTHKKAATAGNASRKYGRSRAIREDYMARLTKLEYELKSGALVQANDVRAFLFKAVRQARDALLTIPDRLGGAISFEIHAVMFEEIRRTCNQLAKDSDAIGKP